MSTQQEQWFPEVSRLNSDRTQFAKQCVEGLKENQRPWFTPSAENPEEESTVLNPSHISKRFSQKNLEEAYRQFLKDSDGNLGQSMSMQYQAGIMSTNERVFRTRHATVPRMLTHSLISKKILSTGKEEDLLKHMAMSFIEAAKESLKKKQ